jgi:protein-disulfide isomerase/uncharacterized membrane protein
MEKSSSSKLAYWIAVVATILCIGVHLYLNKHHVDLKLGLGSASSICNVSEKLNCDTAATSSYAELFGIPMALLGAFTAGFLLIFLFLAQFNLTNDSARTARYAFYLASFMVLVSVVMGGISLFILKSGCPFCMASYALSLILWAALWVAFKPDLHHFADDLKNAFVSEKWVLITLISIPVLAFLVNNMTLASYGYQEIKRVTQDSLGQWKTAPPQNFDLETGLIFQNGDGPAKVTIVEFADFLCPHCKAASPNLHNFAKAHPDVKFIFKSFPLDGACNSVIPHKGDGKRCDYAYATFCAEKLNKKGWAALDYFFDHQESLYSAEPTKVFDDFCQTSGIDCAPLKTCVNSEEIHEQVSKMAKEGETAQIAGTPSIFFNGKSLNGGQLPPVLENTYREFDK